MKTLYVVPWYKCTLNCSHCNVKNRKVQENYTKFLEVFKSTDVDNTILFGGEPLFNHDKFEEIILTGKINSVSTNLILPSSLQFSYFREVMLPLLTKYDISIATSWNPNRFTSKREELWLNAIKELSSLDILLLITLTEDLFTSTSIYEILRKVELAGCKKFLFEPYISTKECNDIADEWLCMFHDTYNGNMNNMLEEKLFNWNCNCDETYTLEPDGIIRKGCPDSLMIKEKYICEECLTCNFSEKCRPCKLQKTCSYPQKLLKKLKEN